VGESYYRRGNSQGTGRRHRTPIQGVLITHNETTTGATTDLKSIRAVLNDLQHPALFMVDAISSLAVTDLPTDELEIDIAVSASQKGLMLPGGLGIIAVSERAWVAYKKASMPRWYWDFTAMKQRMATGQLPYTPAIGMFFGLKAALQLLESEGLEAVLERHTQNANAVQVGAEALGLRLFVKDPAQRSSAVTAVHMPKGLAYNDLGEVMKGYGVVIGGGLARLDGKIFRIGHLGMLHEAEVLAILGVLEICLAKLSVKVSLGGAVQAAQCSYLGPRRGA